MAKDTLATKLGVKAPKKKAPAKPFKPATYPLKNPKNAGAGVKEVKGK